MNAVVKSSLSVALLLVVVFATAWIYTGEVPTGPAGPWFFPLGAGGFLWAAISAWEERK